MKTREEKNSLETRAHLEAMVLRTKPEANQWLHLNPRVAALGADAFQQGPVMITKIHAYFLKEVKLAENAGEKTAEVREQNVSDYSGNLLDPGSEWTGGI